MLLVFFFLLLRLRGGLRLDLLLVDQHLFPAHRKGGDVDLVQHVLQRNLDGLQLLRLLFPAALQEEECPHADGGGQHRDENKQQLLLALLFLSLGFTALALFRGPGGLGGGFGQGLGLFLLRLLRGRLGLLGHGLGLFGLGGGFFRGGGGSLGGFFLGQGLLLFPRRLGLFAGGFHLLGGFFRLELGLLYDLISLILFQRFTLLLILKRPAFSGW